MSNEAIADWRHFETLLADCVVQRFERLTNLSVATALLQGCPLSSNACTAIWPKHPLCGDDSDDTACRESRRAHLERLRRNRGTHWHRCPFGRWCAVTSIAAQERCLAICCLVGPCDMSGPAFGQHVELLDTIVDNFNLHHASRLVDILPENRLADSQSSAAPLREVSPKGDPHERVRMALDHIERHLADSALSVAGVARHLGVNASYLAHLFAGSTGVRMRKYITIRRIELAKSLLDRTQWQIKRIAYESGHRNADWFSEVFRKHTGMTPSAYRHRGRA